MLRVKPYIPWIECRNRLQVGCLEIAFHNTVFIKQDLCNCQLDLLAGLVVPEGPRADYNVELLTPYPIPSLRAS